MIHHNPAGRMFYSIMVVSTLVVTATLLTPPQPAQAAVTLAYFYGVPSGGVMSLRWETGSEIDTLGFYVWRSTSAYQEGDQVTNYLIPAVGGAGGATYVYTDTTALATMSYWYRLESVNRDGTSADYYACNNPISLTGTATPTVPPGVTQQPCQDAPTVTPTSTPLPSPSATLATSRPPSATPLPTLPPIPGQVGQTPTSTHTPAPATATWTPAALSTPVNATSTTMPTPTPRPVLTELPTSTGQTRVPSTATTQPGQVPATATQRSPTATRNGPLLPNSPGSPQPPPPGSGPAPVIPTPILTGPNAAGRGGASGSLTPVATILPPAAQMQPIEQGSPVAMSGTQSVPPGSSQPFVANRQPEQVAGGKKEPAASGSSNGGGNSGPLVIGAGLLGLIMAGAAGYGLLRWWRTAR